MLEKNCEICKNKIFDFQYLIKDFIIVKCRQCGLIFVINSNDNNQIYNLDYFQNSKYYSDYFGNCENYIKIFSDRFKIISSYFSEPGSILDIGCASGYFLEVALKNNWNCRGLDIVEGIDRFASPLIRDKIIIYKNISDIEFGNSVFDIITFFDSLEHFKHPTEYIKRCRKWLKDDGLLVITVPNIESYFSKILGKRWPHFVPEEHLYYFTKKTLSKLLVQNSFEIIKFEKLYYRFQLSEILNKFFNMRKYKSSILKNNNFFSGVSITLNTGDIFVIAKKI